MSLSKIIVQDEYEGFIVSQMQKYIKGDVHGLGDNVTMRKVVGDISFFFLSLYNYSQVKSSSKFANSNQPVSD